MAEDEAATEKSIINPKYKDKYKGPKDWFSTLCDAECTSVVTREVKEKDEHGIVTTKTVDTKKRILSLDALFDFAAANAIDARMLYGHQVDRPGAPGRLRMTVGNMLRRAARQRHGLYDLGGNWRAAPADWLGDAVKTHNPDGTTIAKAKASDETEAQEAA